MEDILSLPIRGLDGTPLTNTFFRQKEEASELAVFFPGRGYTCAMPVLYYPTRLMVQRGADALTIEYNASREAGFDQLDMEERLRRLGNDARNAVEVALTQRKYRRVVLFGKSLGSLVLAWLLVHELELLHATYVWLTPLVRVPFLREAVRRGKPLSLFIAGDADPLFDSDAMQDLMKQGDFHLLVLSGANHSLEIEGDLEATLKGMSLMLRTLDEFLRKG